MGVVELLLIGAGLAMDALAVAVAKGLASGRPAPHHALVVAVWFGGFQGLMALAGWALGSAFMDLIAAVDHWIAFALLALIGVNMIREALAEGKAAASVAAGEGAEGAEGGEGAAGEGAGESAESDASLAPKVMLLLALATSIDALAVGINFALLDVNIWLAVALIGGITFLISGAGYLFGGVLGGRFKTRAQIAGGVVLIAIGIKILLEHTLLG